MISQDTGTAAGPWARRLPSAIMQWAPPLPWRLFRSLRVILVALTAAAMLPLLAIIIYSGIEARESAVHAAADDLLRVVGNLALVQERLTAATHRMLSTLALVPGMGGPDRDRDQDLLRHVAAVNPVYGTIFVTDPAGNVLASSRPFEPGTTVADRKHFTDAIATRGFSGGEHIVARMLKLPVFPFAFPVQGKSGEVVALLMASLDLSQFGDLFSREDLPRGAFLELVDHRGIRLFRTPYGQDDRTGEPVSPAAWPSAGETGTFVAKSADGKPLLFAYRHLRLAPASSPYMTMMVGIPEEIIGADARRTTLRNVSWAVAAVAAALLMVWVIARWTIIARLDRLARAAGRFGAGDFRELTGVDHKAGELGLLAAAMDNMAAERRSFERGLVQAKLQADMANRAKSEFLANMSHGLRTPLNSICGFSEVMLAETFGPLGHRKYAEYIGDIHASGTLLLGIISDILDLSLVEAGTVRLDRGWVDVNAVLAAVSRLVSERAGRKRLSVSLVLDRHQPRLFADELRLKQVLLNLIDNAIRFTPPEGSIVLSSCATSEDGVRASVADTGIGMAEDQVRAALQPFGQMIADSQRRGRSGTGLGIPIAKSLVELHGGTLDIESTPGLGTTVSVTFPPSDLDGPDPAPMLFPDSDDLEVKKCHRLAATGPDVC